MKQLTIFAALASLMLATTPLAQPKPVKSVAVPAKETAQNLPQATIIYDRAAADRLLAASGITLQWLDWDTRGPLSITDEGGLIRISGSQQAKDGPGRLQVDGVVSEIGPDYFILNGTISIADTPDIGRQCSAKKAWRFAITQNRQYWRLREFEWCDELTDYVDIYF